MTYGIHEIHSGRYNSGILRGKLHTGFSYLRGEDNFYTVKLDMFPVHSYFLAKNKNNDRYTIFSKILRDEEGIRFLRPVGHGKLLEDSNSLLLLKFNMPRMTMFMDLFPKNRS